MQPLNVIMIGAHPDDCEIRCGGTAARFSTAGHRVKFVSMTDGSAGHQTQFGPEIAARRSLEASEAARRLGIAAYDVLPHPDGRLEATLAVREQVIRLIRQWHADIVVTHRPNDYHPDHRYTSVLVEDSAFMVTVPAICSDTMPLRRNPVFLYMEDGFTRPCAFRPDVVVDVGVVWQQKVAGVDAHVSQFYEWLPWVDEVWADPPSDATQRNLWLGRKLRGARVTDTVRASFERRYGKSMGETPVEAFELCEYGRRAEIGELDVLFPK